MNYYQYDGGSSSSYGEIADTGDDDKWFILLTRMLKHLELDGRNVNIK